MENVIILFTICCYAKCHYSESRLSESHDASCGYADYRYAESHYALCCYAECHCGTQDKAMSVQSALFLSDHIELPLEPLQSQEKTRFFSRGGGYQKATVTYL